MGTLSIGHTLPVNKKTKPQHRARTGRELLKRYSTVATIVTFVVAAVTGVLLFFHIGNAYLMGLHQWVSMAFVAAAVAHVARHLKPFTGWMSKPRTWVAAALVVLVTAGFIGQAALAPDGGNPFKQLTGVTLEAPVSALSQLLGTTPDKMVVRFAEAGVPGVEPNQTLKDIAAATGVDLKRLLGIVLQENPGR